MEIESELDHLLEAVRTGDRAAAAALVRHLEPQVSKIVGSYRSLRANHEDLCQEVFMSIFSDLHQYRGPQPFAHWVSRIAVTTCLDALRREKRRSELRWADLSDSERTLIEKGLADVADSLHEESRHAREIVDKLLASLSAENRLVITMFSLEGRSLDEIAQATGWGLSRVKVRAFRARQQLRKLFHKLLSREKS